MPVGNFLVGAVLRSPMHRVMSGSLLLLTFQGRRTGKDYTFPVGYARFGPDELVVLAGRPEGKTWWTNLRGGMPARVRLGGRELEGDARLVKGEEAISRLTAYLEQLPRAARSMGITPGPEGKFPREGLDALAAKVPVVSIKLRAGGRPQR
ncbi:MAG TPA: nitroreductase family deazaflavin-dependent oxidoreductase [Acidimicrobiia bacterium]|nr:nitroreductase family deazaflavin-dependent oxidoreductase [Acidimicrobiia bacterium]